MRVRRLTQHPIIYPHMDDRMGDNINGPSLIRVPDWLPNPLGKYYLYFAHHKGTYIRLAYSDHLEGPWQIYRPGVLDLKDAYCNEHVASPEVLILSDRKEIRMYYHGCCMPNGPKQVTRLASSNDGHKFTALPEILGSSYWRTFEWKGFTHALEMPGRIKRSKDGISNFEEGPQLFSPNMRHAALKLVDSRLYVFYSSVQDCPEQILFCTIDLSPDWLEWKETAPTALLQPVFDYEGVDFPVTPSKRGWIAEPVHQLRDPCIFEEDNKTFLLYTVAGEQGIAIAELIMD